MSLFICSRNILLSANQLHFETLRVIYSKGFASFFRQLYNLQGYKILLREKFQMKWDTRGLRGISNSSMKKKITSIREENNMKNESEYLILMKGVSRRIKIFTQTCANARCYCYVEKIRCTGMPHRVYTYPYRVILV